jgi:uncharacterized protein (TIGR02246 family)
MIAHPRELATAFARAWNRSDATALAALFTENADFVGVGGLWWTSRTQIEAAHAYQFRHAQAGSSMVMERVNVRMLSESVAVVHAVWSLSRQPAPDTETGHRGVISLVGVRDGGGWSAISAHNTLIGREHEAPPLPERTTTSPPVRPTAPAQ